MKIGFLSLPLSGHLNPMTALARNLQSRGNEVVFFGVPDVESAIRAAGITYVPVCEKVCPPGSLAKIYEPISRKYGQEVIRYQLSEISPDHLRVMLEHLPQKLQKPELMLWSSILCTATSSWSL